MKFLLSSVLLVISSCLYGLDYYPTYKEAIVVAEMQGKGVILFTGRTKFCPNPQEAFENILKEFPKIETMLKDHILAIEFIYPPKSGPMAPVAQARHESSSGAWKVYDRFDIKLFYPTLTFIDKGGNLVGGPFTKVGRDSPWLIRKGTFSKNMPDFLAK